MTVTRPLCLVESRSQDAAANAGVLSVKLNTVLYYHLQLLIDIERENIPFVHSPCKYNNHLITFLCFFFAIRLCSDTH